MVLERKIFKCFSHYKPIADNDAPAAWPIWTLGSQLAGIIKGLTKHCFTQNIKSSGPHGFREEYFFYVFLSNDPSGVANLDPRGMIGRIYEGYHLTLLHTKYLGFRPCGFREEDFFHIFPIISLC